MKYANKFYKLHCSATLPRRPPMNKLTSRQSQNNQLQKLTKATGGFKINVTVDKVEVVYSLKDTSHFNEMILIVRATDGVNFLDILQLNIKFTDWLSSRSI